MIKLLSSILILIFYADISIAQNQGITNNWILGYGSYWGAPNGHTTMDFYSGVPVINSDSLEMDLNRCAATISDAAGNLLFYTNGYHIADATHDTMNNGNNISPSGWSTLQPEGLNVPQACLILPVPDSAGMYYLFHSTLDNAPYYNRGHYLYMSKIDMSLNGGLGSVVSKNNIILQDTVNPGKITACKHANGRDWWVICQRVNSNTYFKFLVTPGGGILGPYIQNIGTTRTWNAGMAGFSPDGNKYASFHAEYQSAGGLDIFDFDRCTGMLSNAVHVVISQTTGFSGGMAFSPNSRYLYTANIEFIYQFDLDAANVPASQVTVATWDGFYSPSPPFGTYFELMQLAPDGKIYVSTGNSTFHMHVMNHPDSASIACDVVQHDLQFQYFYANALPNHPNYFLGCDTSGSCICLTTAISEVDTNFELMVYPNPTTGPLTLQYNVSKYSGELFMYDVLGNLVMRNYIAPWSQYKKVDISNFESGIYFGRISRNDSEISFKIIKK